MTLDSTRLHRLELWVNWRLEYHHKTPALGFRLPDKFSQMILSLFDFKESITGHRILSHNQGPKAVLKRLGDINPRRKLTMNFQIFRYPLYVMVDI